MDGLCDLWAARAAAGPVETGVLVVGAGQAGLAAGYHLQRRGLEVLIVDGAARAGGGWHRRYDSLSLFTPRAFSALPGLALAGDPQGFPSGAEFAAYLETYARHFALPLSLGDGILRLTRIGDLFRAERAGGGIILARAVILATGAFPGTRVPAFAADLDLAIRQIAADDYRRPADLGPGPVLIVGDGAAGRDIALDLAGTRPVALAGGRRRRLLPERLLGQSLWWWLARLGLLRVGPDSRLGRFMRRADPFPDRGRGTKALARRGIELLPRASDAAIGGIRLDDGRIRHPATVIWATGPLPERPDWIEIDGLLEADGSIRQRGGETAVPGLYTLGRPWQRNRASGLALGVGDDAALIAARIAGAASG
ncbi:NAD(P)-binding domain-containing protein [Zavarzinia compransoris]|uniref:Potassium transporter n=1 Tax=Zavarzinia compransoris TaxID=1264899 RepID=A0A317E7A6_9PROT|nr:NAD(P)-binding domain-containing protein [Zavarzinia compransoris]PWR22160.1 potassium transporter [Zavarzinia compransoris]TDP47089.1 putative flavoprotein involved in K+ transport [Zavarzinia compransoris]